MAYIDGPMINKVLIKGVLHPIADNRIEGTNFAYVQIAGDVVVDTPLTAEQLAHITPAVLSEDGAVFNIPALGTILIPKDVVIQDPAPAEDYKVVYTSSPLEGKVYNLEVTIDHTTGEPKEAVVVEGEVATPPVNIAKTDLEEIKATDPDPTSHIINSDEAKALGQEAVDKKANIIVETDADGQPIDVYHATESPEPDKYYRYIDPQNHCIDIYFTKDAAGVITVDGLLFPDQENIYVEKAKEYMEISTTQNSVIYKSVQPVMVEEHVLGFEEVEAATQTQGINGIIHYPKSVLFTSPNEFKISFKSGGMPSYQTTAKIEMSNDGLNWFANDETNGVASALNNELGAHAIFIRSDDYINSTSSYSSGMFYTIKTLAGNDITVKGILDALWGGKPLVGGLCYNLFLSNTGIKDVSDLILPNTTKTSIYEQMFNGCTNLISAPASLPAKTVEGRAYSLMFNNCSSLVNIPNMAPESISDSAMDSMFAYCSSLNSTPNLSLISSIPSEGMDGMFLGCTSLVEPPALPATTLAEGCYRNMFSGCTLLAHAPELPATTLATQCYNGMFKGCTSLTTPPTLPATTLEDNCYSYMFSGCTSLTKPVFFPHFTNMEVTGLADMFENCSSITWGDTGTPYKIEYGDGTDVTTEIDDMFAGNGGTAIPERPKTNTVYYLAV